MNEEKMAAVKDFVENSQAEKWENVLDNYSVIISGKAKTKTKSTAAKELLELDKW